MKLVGEAVNPEVSSFRTYITLEIERKKNEK